MMMSSLLFASPAIVTEQDLRELWHGLHAVTDEERPFAEWLRERLLTATVIPQMRPPRGLVALGTQVRVLRLLDGFEREFRLVPHAHSPDGQELGVFTALGVALFGRRAGQVVVPVGEPSMEAVRIVKARAPRSSRDERSPEAAQRLEPIIPVAGESLPGKPVAGESVGAETVAEESIPAEPDCAPGPGGRASA
jgi:hypothetical protein